MKLSDGREWAIRMSEKGYSYKTIENYKRSLRVSFYMAIQDDCIRKNPFDFKLSDVLEDDTKPKAILTPEQEQRLLAFVRINRRRKKKTITVDGYTGFLFLNCNGLPKTSGNYESMVRGLIKKYNKTHSESEQLPAVTPHSFWHTYCTNMANKGMNPNTLQYVMGHANITMTLGYYAHGSFESARAEIQRLVA